MNANVSAADFKAYYTRLGFQDKISGQYADIVVQFTLDKRFVFSREFSYLPFWQMGESKWSVKEIVPRSGDGPEERPDSGNWYSYVRIIENKQEKIVLHWRYFPDLRNVEWDGVVDEYFTITPDFKVVRTIKKGTKKTDIWEDPSHMLIKELHLTANGIKEISRSKGKGEKRKIQQVTASPVRFVSSSNQALCFTFNEGMRIQRDIVHEVQTNVSCAVEGYKTLWKAGISGTALAFDGYYSAIRMSGHHVPEPVGGWTLEGWVALGAYPFGWAPVAHQSQWGEEGFYLGVNQEGYPGVHTAFGDQWISAVDSSRLNLFQWIHLAGQYDEKSRLLRLFVNGQEKRAISVPEDNMKIAEQDFIMGLNNIKLPNIQGRIRIGKWPSLFGLDGLIDEVRFYDKALQPDEIKVLYSAMLPPDEIRIKPDMEKRQFPKIPEEVPQNKFGGYYTKLKYYETWDNLWRVGDYPDVVVNFDAMPVHFISWRGFSNGPALVTENNKWAGDQSSENYRELDDPSEAEGCCEHMSDKQCRHAHIRMIENTDARVILHYRYGMVDSRYLFVYSGHDSLDWGDEYWTIYPDGAAVRYLDRGPVWGDSWVETMFFSEPGTRPEDNVDLKAYTLVNMKGESETYSWEKDSPECDLPDPVISMIKMKSKYKPFNIYPTDSEIETFPGHNRRSRFHWWNHWPVSQITSDGRSARAADRAAHSSLVWGIPSENYLMYGLTDKPPESLIPLAKSWNHPPEIRQCQGCISSDYIQKERAYHLTARSSELSFALKGSEKRPVVNPCFVIKDWPSDQIAEITVDRGNGSILAKVRQGLTWNTQGSRSLIIWLEYQSESTMKFEIMTKSLSMKRGE